MTFTDKLFSFQGRTTRADYWLSFLAVVAVLVVAMLILVFAVERFDVSEGGITMLVILAYLICLLPILAIGNKRCHDRDKSGWWYLGWTVGGLIPYVGVLISLWALIELGFLDGTQGPNRYGPSPKGIGGGSKLTDVFS